MQGRWRTVFYIDGFNLYFGLRENKWKKYYWLNLEKMCSGLLRSDQSLEKIRR